MGKRQGVRDANLSPRSPTRPRAFSPLVGRDEELRHLGAALTLAAEGHGSVVFLTGEPGIGKTRLAREALALAKERGFTVLEGRTFPLEAGLAYAPFVDAFGALLRSFDSSHVMTLVSDLPSLGRLFEGLQLPLAAFPSEGLGDPALDKTRLFEAVSRLLERLTYETPVALFIDDVHRSDPASLDLFHYVARGVSGQRALLLATCDFLDCHHGLRTIAGPLERDGTAQEIVVPRLGQDSVGKMARGILGGCPSGAAPEKVLALLHARASGTPLFVEALLVSLLESGNLVRCPSEKDGWTLHAEGAKTLPQSVRRLILDRLERLAPVDRRIFDLMAVMGDATEHTLLRVLLEKDSLEEDALIEGVQRLRTVGLVVEGQEVPGLTYSIAHPLIQEVAYAELPVASRQRLHLVAIDALQSFAEGRPTYPATISGRALSRLAYHYHRAGPKANPSHAVAALIAAGERALNLYANEEAARHFEAALALLRGGQGSGNGGRGDLPTAPKGHPPQPSTVAEVLELLGEAWERVGRRGAAVEVWNEALVLLSEGLAETERAGPSEGRNVAASRLRRQLAQAEWARGRFDIATAHVRTGLAVLVSHEPCQELVDLYFVRFFLLRRAGDMAGAADTLAKLLSLAEQLASPRAEAEANAAAADVLLVQGDIVAARERAVRVLTIGESASGGQELGLCCRAHSLLVSTGMRLGEYDFVREHAERGLAIARRLGAPSAEVLLRAHLAYAHFLAGAWEESLSASFEAVALARRVGHPRDLAYALAEWAVILAFQGDWLKAESCIAQARIAFVSPSKAGRTDRGVFAVIRISEAAIALERGQIDRAVAIAKGFLAPSEPVHAPSELTTAYAQIGLTLLAETQVAAGEPEKALETARRLTGLGPSGTPYLTALASRVDGLARRALGQRDAAFACLASAEQTFAALEMPFETARCLVEEAEMAGAGRPDLAVKAAQQSLAIFERLGAQRYADRARRLLRGLGVTPLATRRPHLGGVTVSKRELQIAQLVAQGLTNTDIADRLTLSLRTVETHLSHIYSRLGTSSRTAIARLVMEAGLLSTADGNT